MRKWFRKFCSSGFFIPLVLLMPYVCTILLNGADKALLLSSLDEEVMVPLLLMVQLKGDYEEEAVKAQAVIARSNLYRRLAAGEQAGKIMEEVSGEVTEIAVESIRLFWMELCHQDICPKSGR